MTEIQWDKVGEKKYETGTDHGVLYLRTDQGTYPNGVPWNGLTGVTQSPTGAESNKKYADNMVYLNMQSAEEFGATIEAFTYPDEYAQCDGSAEVAPGLFAGQQRRRAFGFSYRSIIGNDVAYNDFGYKLHLIYNAQSGVAEVAHATVNDSPEPVGLSWEITTTPEVIGTVGGVKYKPTAKLTIDSTKVSAAKLLEIETILYGAPGVDPRLPLPTEVISIMAAGASTVVDPVAPTYTPATKTIAIPTTTGVTYMIDGVAKTGNVVITKDTVVTAVPKPGYKFPPVTDDDWLFKFA